jgi:hypothetical protein
MGETTNTSELGPGQRTALGGAIILAVTLASYGAVGSYKTISNLATDAGVPLPRLVPIGIDGGLVGVVVLDLVLAWTGHPVGWLRQLARLLTFGTVAANVTAGWPHPVAIGLHAAAPLMLLAMVEAGRAVLLRRAGLASGTARDGVPYGRWILSPWRTWLLWRRMVLWQITSYRRALETEARLRRARTLLRMRFGRRWKRKAPADLVWMLGIAPFADEACARVNALIMQDQHTDPTVAASEDRVHKSGQPTPADEATKMNIEPSQGADQFEAVVKINKRHWEQRGRPVSAETVRKHLKVGAARARELTREIRAMDRVAVRHEMIGAAD